VLPGRPLRVLVVVCDGHLQRLRLLPVREIREHLERHLRFPRVQKHDGNGGGALLQQRRQVNADVTIEPVGKGGELSTNR